MRDGQMTQTLERRPLVNLSYELGEPVCVSIQKFYSCTLCYRPTLETLLFHPVAL